MQASGPYLVRHESQLLGLLLAGPGGLKNNFRFCQRTAVKIGSLFFDYPSRAVTKVPYQACREAFQWSPAKGSVRLTLSSNSLPDSRTIHDPPIAGGVACL